MWIVDRCGSLPHEAPVRESGAHADGADALALCGRVDVEARVELLDPGLGPFELEEIRDEGIDLRLNDISIDVFHEVSNGGGPIMFIPMASQISIEVTSA